MRQRANGANDVSGTTNLFVYGTLMPGACNYRLIESQVHSARPASTSGLLVDLGRFPAMIAGDGIVRGVVLEVDPAALTVTDRLEGVPHFYRRLEVLVSLQDGSQVVSWTYVLADSSRIADCPRLVVDRHGDVPVHAWPIS